MPLHQETKQSKCTCLNNRVTKYVKLSELKQETQNSTIAVRDSKTQFSVTEKTIDGMSTRKQKT